MPGSAVTDLAPLRLRHWIVRPKACPAPRQGMGARSAPWSRRSFTEGKRGDFIGTGSHYWVGDNSGQYADPTGPSASELQWSFFKAHPFRETPPPSISISSAQATGNSISMNGTASASASSGCKCDRAARWPFSSTNENRVRDQQLGRDVRP